MSKTPRVLDAYRLRVRPIRVRTVSSSRQGRPRIAHRFNGGVMVIKIKRVPSGTKENLYRQTTLLCRSCLSPLSGLDRWERALFPPMNRWAIVGSPSRDNQAEC